MSKMEKYIVAFFIGAVIVVIGGFFMSAEKRWVFAGYIMIGGIVMVIARFLFQMKSVETNTKRHKEIIDEVGDVKEAIEVLGDCLKRGNEKINFRQFDDLKN